MRSRLFSGFDPLLFASSIVLVFVGILFIYSSGVSSTGIVFSNEYIKQIIWAATGIAFVLLIYYFDYSRLEVFSLYIYLIFIVLLIITLFFRQSC